MLVDVTKFPVIDNHCHPCPPSREKRPFWRCFNSTLFEQTEFDAKSTVLMHMVSNELRDFMGMDKNSTMDEVFEERNKRFKADPSAWINALARDAGIEEVIADITYPVTAWYTGKFITEAELQEYYDAVKDFKVNKQIRFEYIYDPIIKAHMNDKNLSFRDFLEQYYKKMDEVVRKERPVSFKSVIGYITGLDVVKHTFEEGETAYYKYLQDPGNIDNEKVLRDYMLYDSMKLCKKYDLPLAIHTGSGNTPMCKIRKMNPTLLTEFLSDDYNRTVTTILLHCGYPYLREMGYLCSHFTQVYTDTSQMVYHAGMAAETGIKELLETCPFSKLMHASDGGGLPEHMWFSAKYFKRALSRTLSYYVEMGVFGKADAEKYAHMILTENAKRIYKL